MSVGDIPIGGKHMAFDGITTAAVVHELNTKLAGGGISRIVQSEKDELVLTVKAAGRPTASS